MQGVRVWSLVGEVRSHLPHSMTQNKKTSDTCYFQAGAHCQRETSRALWRPASSAMVMALSASIPEWSMSRDPLLSCDCLVQMRTKPLSFKPLRLRWLFVTAAYTCLSWRYTQPLRSPFGSTQSYHLLNILPDITRTCTRKYIIASDTCCAPSRFYFYFQLLYLGDTSISVYK